jgi:hypothetical protein
MPATFNTTPPQKIPLAKPLNPVPKQYRHPKPIVPARVPSG